MEKGNEIVCFIIAVTSAAILLLTASALVILLFKLVLSLQERNMDRKVVELLVSWMVEAGFGYDNIPDLYNKYKKDIEKMGYNEGLIYIALKEVEE